MNTIDDKIERCRYMIKTEDHKKLLCFRNSDCQYKLNECYQYKGNKYNRCNK